MSYQTTQAAPFHVVGQFLGFIFKEGDKIKYIKMTVQEREYWFKIPKELRPSLDLSWQPGSSLEIEGFGTINRKKGKLELKADSVRPLSLKSLDQSAKTLDKTQKGKILVCQKSDCWKRGGQKICQNLEQELQERGLGELISIQRTGCLKKCKKAPNLVVLPQKAYYHQVDPQTVGTLLDSHFGG